MFADAKAFDQLLYWNVSAGADTTGMFQNSLGSEEFSLSFYDKILLWRVILCGVYCVFQFLYKICFRLTNLCLDRDITSKYFYSACRCHVRGFLYLTVLSNFYFVDRVRMLIHRFDRGGILFRRCYWIDRGGWELSIDAKIVPFRSINVNKWRNYVLCFPSWGTDFWAHVFAPKNQFRSSVVRNVNVNKWQQITYSYLYLTNNT